MVIKTCCLYLSRFWFSIWYFQNNPGNKRISCPIIVTFTINILFGVKFLQSMRSKGLFFFHLLFSEIHRRFTYWAYKPGNNGICLIFTSETLGGAKERHITTLWQVSSMRSHTLLYWHKGQRPAASLSPATLLSCLVLCPGKHTLHLPKGDIFSTSSTKASRQAAAFHCGKINNVNNVVKLMNRLGIK